MNTLSYCVAMQHMANELNLTEDKLNYATEALLIIDGLKDTLHPEVMNEVYKIISHKNVIINKTANPRIAAVASLSGYDHYVNNRIIISKITFVRDANIFNISYFTL